MGAEPDPGEGNSGSPCQASYDCQTGGSTCRSEGEGEVKVTVKG